jgi:ubiquinone/menaquinone biosynthesis C-methylase UbiE
VSLVGASLDARRLIRDLFRKYPRLAGLATIASGILVSLAVLFHLPAFVILGGAAGLLVTSFSWGYWVRFRRQVLWPPLYNLQRRQYAEVWDSLAASPALAAAAASGKQSEAELRHSAKPTVDNLLEFARVGPQDDLLEIGCGVGRIGRELAPHCHSWTGTDRSANMLGYAAKRLQDLGNIRLQVLQGTALDEIADNSVDVVYCTNVIPHLDEMDCWLYVQDALRVLRPGGRIFLDTIDLESDEGWGMFARGVARSKDFERPPYAGRFSTASELSAYASRAGFENVKAHRKPPLLIVTALKNGPGPTRLM